MILLFITHPTAHLVPSVGEKETRRKPFRCGRKKTNWGKPMMQSCVETENSFHMEGVSFKQDSNRRSTEVKGRERNR